MTQGRSIQVGDQVKIRVDIVGLEEHAGKVAVVTKIIPQLDGVLMIVSLIEDGTQLMVYEPPKKVDRIEQV